jgi:hypothetical protein
LTPLEVQKRTVFGESPTAFFDEFENSVDKLLTGLDKLFGFDKIKIAPSPKTKNKSDVKRQTHSSLTEHPKPPQHQNPRNSKPQNTKHKTQTSSQHHNQHQQHQYPYTQNNSSFLQTKNQQPPNFSTQPHN